MKTHKIYIGLGSNLGDRESLIKEALTELEKEIGPIESVSNVYETKPIGFSSENLFLNAACIIDTSLSPQEILKKTQQIEKRLGRKQKSRNEEYSDRSIDLDLLFYDDSIISDNNLTIPHPHLHKRMFVLLPLNEIAPHKMHPIMQKEIDELIRLLNANP